MAADHGSIRGIFHGGIISLARFVIDHREAIEYDLITKTGHELSDVGRTLSWSALESFVSCMGAESALARDIDIDRHLWATTEKTNGLLADIFDMLAQINANLVATGTGKKANKPKPYPRPGSENESSEEKHFGRGALPIDELKEWFENKRKERDHGRRND